MRASLWLLLALFILGTALGLASDGVHHHQAPDKSFFNAWRHNPGLAVAGWAGVCFVVIGCVTLDSRLSARAGVLRVPFVPPRA